MKDKDGFVEAYLSGVPHENLTEERQRQNIYINLLHTYMLKGYSYNSAGVDDIAFELNKFVSKKHGYLHDAEIKLAWEMGARGEFGKDTYPSIANLQSWLNAFASSPERMKAINAYRQEEIAQQTQDEEVADRIRAKQRNEEFYAEAPRRLYENYIQTGELGISIPHIGTLIYDYLADKRVDDMPISEDELKEETRKYRLFTSQEDVISCIKLKRLYESYCEQQGAVSSDDERRARPQSA